MKCSTIMLWIFILTILVGCGGGDSGETPPVPPRVSDQFTVKYTIAIAGLPEHSITERTFYATVDGEVIDTDADGIKNDGSTRYLPLADLVRHSNTAPEWELSITSIDGIDNATFTWDLADYGLITGDSAIFSPQGPAWIDGKLIVKTEDEVVATFPLPRLVSVGAPASQNWRFGVMDFQGRPQYNQAYGNDQCAEAAAILMADAGVEVLREQWFWQNIEPSKSDWNFRHYDDMLDMFERHGLKALPLLVGSATWNTSGNPDGQLFDWLYYPPRFECYRDYGTYCRVLAERYRDRISMWEIWNEVNGPDFWPPEPNVIDYTALLKLGWLGIKYGNPQATVVLGGLQGDGLEIGTVHDTLHDDRFQPNYLHALYQDCSAQQWWDVVAIHPFIKPSLGIEVLNDRIQNTLSEMIRHSDESELWITAICWPTDNWTLWPGDDLTSAEKADWITAIYTEADPRITKIVWFSVVDPATPLYPVGIGHGLLLVDEYGNLEKTPGYEAYKAVTEKR